MPRTILAVNMKGDTIQVPINELKNYNFINHWQFQYRDSWYGYYDWYNRVPFYNRWYVPRYKIPTYKPYKQPKVVIPNKIRVQPQINRGRSNQTRSHSNTRLPLRSSNNNRRDNNIYK